MAPTEELIEDLRHLDCPEASTVALMGPRPGSSWDLDQRPESS